MAFQDWLPFRQTPRVSERRAQALDVDDQRTLAKMMKAVAMALGLRNVSTGRSTFERAPYDFDRIIKACDTDSYVRQGYAKYKELTWKEGWEIVGENPEAVAYLYQRLDFMSLAMGRHFSDFAADVADQMVKFGNAFLAKSRGDLAPFFPARLTPLKDELPLIGYELLPTETIEIRRDRHNRPLRYRQRVKDIAAITTFGNTREPSVGPSWAPEDIIHLALDRKPGRAYGTPFAVTLLDDVVALRQIEEDIQNLVHRELFPLYKYKVGTEEHPAEPDEVEHAAEELANLRTEGGLVLPDRHDVEVIGAEGNSLDATGYLAHFKERVCVGLGLSPHHLGMLMNGGNRSVTDRLDIALYDKVKIFQRYLARMIELHIFWELLLEGGFDPFATPIAKGMSDRCNFRFREIDVDTQVKRENHEIQKFSNNIHTLPETRLALGDDPEADEDDLLLAMTTRLQPTPAPAPKAPGLPAPKALKPDAKAPSTGGKANRPNTTRKTGNLNRPANQHGRRTSPNIRHMDEAELTEIVCLLGEGED